MTVNRRMEIALDILEECKKNLIAKGASYAGDGDSLNNFKQVGTLLGLTPHQVLCL